MNVKGWDFFKTARLYCTKPTTNNEIKPFIYNRNPRNLERMRIATKPNGWVWEKKLTQYWHRLCYERNKDGISAKLIHNTGNVVIKVSTGEPSISKFIYSRTDRRAHTVLGKIFALRCMESGIISMQSDIHYSEGSNVEEFLKEILRHGVSLEEPPYFDINDKWKSVREKKPWTVLE